MLPPHGNLLTEGRMPPPPLGPLGHPGFPYDMEFAATGPSYEELSRQIHARQHAEMMIVARRQEMEMELEKLREQERLLCMLDHFAVPPPHIPPFPPGARMPGPPLDMGPFGPPPMDMMDPRLVGRHPDHMLHPAEQVHSIMSRPPQDAYGGLPVFSRGGPGPLRPDEYAEPRQRMYYS